MYWKKPKKTALKKSLICDSYGLFTLEDIKENEYICEYLGDLTSREESDRRTLFLDQLGCNYLFKYGKNADIDAYRSGNEMR